MSYTQKIISLCLLLSGLYNPIGSQTYSKETIVIETDLGTMKIKLFEETSLHKANFLKLVNEGSFDSLLFHRVINQFMIQGGDPLSKRALAGDTLGHGDIGYTVPAEFNEKLFHKRGSLCAARESDDINPKKESSASQFYLVMGKIRSLEDLAKYEERINKKHYENCYRNFTNENDGRSLKLNYERLLAENKNDSALLISKKIEEKVMIVHLKTPLYKFNKTQIDYYTTIGGTPHLDGTYTVFGDVIEGIEVISRIAQVATDKRDRPVTDIRMKVWLLKD